MLIEGRNAYFLFIFLKSLFIFREREREGEREGEKHKHVVVPHTPPTRDLAYNPGMCPEWESNRRPSGSQAGVQSTECGMLILLTGCIICYETVRHSNSLHM